MTRLNKEHKKHLVLNTRWLIIGKEDTPGNNHRTNQIEKLKRATKMKTKSPITKKNKKHKASREYATEHPLKERIPDAPIT